MCCKRQPIQLCLVSLDATAPEISLLELCSSLLFLSLHSKPYSVLFCPVLFASCTLNRPAAAVSGRCLAYPKRSPLLGGNLSLNPNFGNCSLPFADTYPNPNVEASFMKDCYR